MKAFDDFGFDYVSFINEGFASQTKYGKKAGVKWTPEELKRVDTMVNLAATTDFEFIGEAYEARYEKVIEMFGHMMEEMIEARVYVPRRSWKNNEPSFMDDYDKRQEFVAEMFDILLFHRAILAYAGVTGEEFAEIAKQKAMYNTVRKDHNINGDVEAQRDPAAELQGNCASATELTRAIQQLEETGPQFSAGPTE